MTDISIHAPAKGATTGLQSHDWWQGFQSTLPRRERLIPSVFAVWSTNFNPRSREGSDDYQEGKEHYTKLISIHAPAKGATPLHHLSRLMVMEFQSTLPRRERRILRQILKMQGYFNPRSREGSDWEVDEIDGCFSISIHAPAKGATLDQLRMA